MNLVVQNKVNEQLYSVTIKNKENEQLYSVTIKNIMRFELALNHVGIGVSFRQAAGVIQHAKNRTNAAKLTESMCAMSLAGDGSTHPNLSLVYACAYVSAVS